MNKDKHSNSLGWTMMITDKLVHTYEPEKIFWRILRYFPMWGPFVILGPRFLHDPTMLIVLVCVAATLGVLLTRRSLSPTFFATGRFCGFGVKLRFKPDQAVLLFNKDAPNEILVLNRKNGMALPVWRCDGTEDRDFVTLHLGKFIKEKAIAEQAPETLRR